MGNYKFNPFTKRPDRVTPTTNIDLANKQLLDGSTVAIDWGLRKLYGANGEEVLDFSKKINIPQFTFFV